LDMRYLLWASFVCDVWRFPNTWDTIWHSQQGVSGLWAWESSHPATSLSLSFFFLFFLLLTSRRLEHQSESNPATSWTPNLWKAFLCLIALKTRVIFPSQLATKLPVWTYRRNRWASWLLYPSSHPTLGK
jgi:hypothetical protein